LSIPKYRKSLVIDGILAATGLCAILVALVEVKIFQWGDLMNAVQIDFLSDDATVKQNSYRWMKEMQNRSARQERITKLLKGINPPKMFGASAGR
jgi:hypothetical protein